MALRLRPAAFSTSFAFPIGSSWRRRTPMSCCAAKRVAGGRATWDSRSRLPRRRAGCMWRSRRRRSRSSACMSAGAAAWRDTRLILGDAWERGYGDLEWRAWVPDRVMPWYFATYDGSVTHAYGVRTGASAFCFWQVDPQGMSLWADVRSGSVGVQLGDRVLDVCDVVCRAGRAERIGVRRTARVLPRRCAPCLACRHSRSMEATTGTGRTGRTAPTPCSPTRHTSSSCRRSAAIAPSRSSMTDGSPGAAADKAGTGTWDRGNEKFPDMPGLAADIRRAGARAWHLDPPAAGDRGRARRVAPSARPHVCSTPPSPRSARRSSTTSRRLRQWGYELIKHDYTTYDIFGRWGFRDGNRADARRMDVFSAGRRRTTAEVIDDLYGAIRTQPAKPRHRLQHRESSVGRTSSRSAALETTRAGPSGRARGRWA